MHGHSLADEIHAEANMRNKLCWIMTKQLFNFKVGAHNMSATHTKPRSYLEQPFTQEEKLEIIRQAHANKTPEEKSRELRGKLDRATAIVVTGIILACIVSFVGALLGAIT